MPPAQKPPLISVVLPCLNEMRHGYLPRILANLGAQGGQKELIAVVSPSQDDTLAHLQETPGWQVVATTARNRAERLMIGIEASRGDVVILHHPATLLPEGNAFEQVVTAIADESVIWGGFRHRFDWNHPLLRFTSWYSNQVRSTWRGIIYLDHCPFVRRSALQAVGGVPPWDIFEDTALSERLRAIAPPHLLPGQVITSARRFRQRGVYRQALLNQQLKLLYHWGASPEWMNQWYEGQLQINVTYGRASEETSPSPSQMAWPSKDQQEH